jgi:hypothetical protein
MAAKAHLHDGPMTLVKWCDFQHFWISESNICSHFLLSLRQAIRIADKRQKLATHCSIYVHNHIYCMIFSIIKDMITLKMSERNNKLIKKKRPEVAAQGVRGMTTCGGCAAR